MKNYSEEVINNIQKIINEGNYTLNQLQSFDEMPNNIHIGGCRIKLSKMNDVHDSMLIPDNNFCNDDMKEWKKEPIGLFYSKDWKSKNKNNDNYKLYYNLCLSVNNVEVVALIRLISSDEINDEDLFNYVKSLEINGGFYTIIKAYSPSINEAYYENSKLEEVTFKQKIMTMYGAIDPAADIDPSKLEEQDIESVELF